MRSYCGYLRLDTIKDHVRVYRLRSELELMEASTVVIRFWLKSLPITSPWSAKLTPLSPSLPFSSLVESVQECELRHLTDHRRDFRQVVGVQRSVWPCESESSYHSSDKPSCASQRVHGLDVWKGRVELRYVVLICVAARVTRASHMVICAIGARQQSQTATLTDTRAMGRRLSTSRV
jgi:hypothetical protein